MRKPRSGWRSNAGNCRRLLFDRKSLAIHPASTIFGLFTPEQCAAMSVPDTTVRLSIGLENGEDLLEDIKQAVQI